MDFGLLFGMMLGLASVFGSFLLEGGHMHMLFMTAPMIVVFGGTLATAMIGNPTARFLAIPTYYKVSMMDPRVFRTQADRGHDPSRRVGAPGRDPDP